MFRILSYRIPHNFPPFTDRHRIKINYGIILAQHLVFCQPNNTISSVFSLSIFVRKKSICKIYFIFFKFFQVSAPLSGTSFLDCPVTTVHLYQASVLWQLKNVHPHVYGFRWMAHCYKSAIRPDIIAHSAASQRGREGRRKRWGKVCVTIKILSLFFARSWSPIFSDMLYL